jgi:hypothetical protein
VALQSPDIPLQVRFHCFRVIHVLTPFSVSKPTHVPPRSRSRASTSSESSSESCSSEDAPLASLVQPQRPGSATSRASGPRHPTKPLVDIGQLVGEKSAIPPRASEPPNAPQLTAEVDSPTARYRKTSSLLSIFCLLINHVHYYTHVVHVKYSESNATMGGGRWDSTSA